MESVAIPHESAACTRAVAPGDTRPHEAEVCSDVACEPAVVPRRLPVPRTPAVVAQSVTVELPPFVSHLHRATRRHQLLVVAPGELLARALCGLIGFAAKHGGIAPVDEVRSEEHTSELQSP